MKYITLILFLISLNIQSQNENKKSWNSCDLYINAQDIKTQEFILKIPTGKIEEIVYDNFFRSYKITYINENEDLGFMDFNFVKVLKDGRVIVKDEKDVMYYVYNMIESSGILLFVGLKIIDENLIAGISIENIKK